MICIHCPKEAKYLYKGNSLCTDHFSKKPVKEKKATPEGLKRFTEHIHKTYLEKKGSKYPFNGETINSCKRLLSSLDLYQCMALWDVFLGKSWDWKTADGVLVKVAHDLRYFQTKITIILEDSSWKGIAQKYEKKDSDPDKKEIHFNFSGIPKKESKHITRNKMLNQLKEEL